jgi:hypothetical protein
MTQRAPPEPPRLFCKECSAELLVGYSSRVVSFDVTFVAESQEGIVIRRVVEDGGAFCSIACLLRYLQPQDAEAHLRTPN